jgi:hypothetical protein
MLNFSYKELRKGANVFVLWLYVDDLVFALPLKLSGIFCILNWLVFHNLVKHNIS